MLQPSGFLTNGLEKYNKLYRQNQRSVFARESSQQPKQSKQPRFFRGQDRRSGSRSVHPTSKLPAMTNYPSASSNNNNNANNNISSSTTPQYPVIQKAAVTATTNSSSMIQSSHNFHTPNLIDLPKHLTAKSILIHDMATDADMLRINDHDKREIASLSKIMTCWVVIQYLRDNQLIPENQFYVVSKNAATISGTSAELIEGDTLSIWDLVHGLMLPSGNDAAICLAENIGDRFSSVHKRKTAQENFVEEMNAWARKLDMKDTHYTNPHGLTIGNKINKSTASDQLILVQKVLEDSIFRKIVDKRLYFCSVQQKDGWTREMFWENTNRLLYKGFSGIKTGSTVKAGYCLASWYKRAQINLVVIILGAAGADERFEQTLALTRWAIKEKCVSNAELLKDRDTSYLFE